MSSKLSILYSFLVILSTSLEENLKNVFFPLRKFCRKIHPTVKIIIPMIKKEALNKTMKIIDSTKKVAEWYNNNPKSKRTRIKIYPDQLTVLEKIFQYNQHPDFFLKKKISDACSLPLKSVQIWFQNRRAKEKSERSHLKNI